jgi:hypothetical protein
MPNFVAVVVSFAVEDVCYVLEANYSKLRVLAACMCVSVWPCMLCPKNVLNSHHRTLHKRTAAAAGRVM